MRLGFGLSLEQTQKLIMTPELRQAIKLLQFTSQELGEYIDKEMESNPLIEINSNSTDSTIEENDINKEDIDWKEYFEEYDYSGYTGRKRKKRKEYTFENFVYKEQSLRDNLLLQLDLTVFDRRKKEIGEFIIENIDRNGYLSNSLQEISTYLGESIDEVSDILAIIQTFDPIGVGARNISECLSLQLKEKNITDPNIYDIVNNHLEDIAQNKLSNISKSLDIDVKKVQKICDIIKSLEPKPGRGFRHEGDEVKFVTPDVYLEIVKGEYIITINDIAAPRLTINSFYKRMLNNSDDNKISKFINNKLNSAMWLIKSIEQRRMTLYKVVNSIIKFQKSFFEKGKTALKPLTLKEVADDIDMHESTVSRATNGKYIQTPNGIYELKYFFSSGISNRSGGIASTSVKLMIKNLIENENEKKPLSDQKIADKLKNKNIKISRRTVAKYRGEMNIPSSTKRKRYS